MNNYLPIVNAIVNKYDINIENAKKSLVFKLLTQYIEVLVFNVVTIISIITMINNTNNIHKEALKLLKTYIDDTCNKPSIKGGSLPSEYFGFNSGIYSENNATGNILDIDFSSGNLRPQIGGGGSSNRKTNKEYINVFGGKIKSIVSYYKLKISNDIVYELINIIITYIDCLFRQLKNLKTVINPSIIKKMIKSNKKLDIFK
jgi:hypothetical protein